MRNLLGQMLGVCVAPLAEARAALAADGAAIEGEIWALPTASIGGLLALVPPPLGFGTVFLEQTTCLGFLAEAEAVLDAPDITHHGGWRGWLATC